MILYHKLSAEITGDDGREWIVTVEPPTMAAAEDEPTKWEVEIRRNLPNWPEGYEDENGTPEPFTYKVPTRDGMFAALNTALNLVPNLRGND